MGGFLWLQGDPFDGNVNTALRQVAASGGVATLLSLQLAEDLATRERAASILADLAASPEFADHLIGEGALSRLYRTVVDPRCMSEPSKLAKYAKAGEGGSPLPLTYAALVAYSSILNHSTDPQDALQAIQNNGLDLVAGLMGSPHAPVSLRALQLLHTFANTKASGGGGDQHTVLALVHAAAGRGSGVIETLVGRAMLRLRSGGGSFGGGGGFDDALMADEELLYVLLSLGSLCGADATIGENVFEGHTACCVEVCRRADALKEFLGVVNGRYGVGACQDAAARLFTALCRNVSSLVQQNQRKNACK